MARALIGEVPPELSLRGNKRPSPEVEVTDTKIAHVTESYTHPA